MIPVAEHTRKNVAIIKASGEHSSFEGGFFSGSHLRNGLVRFHADSISLFGLAGNPNLGYPMRSASRAEAICAISCEPMANWSSTGCLR